MCHFFLRTTFVFNKKSDIVLNEMLEGELDTFISVMQILT